MQARGNRARLASSLAAAVAAFLLLAGGVRADQPVGITAEQPWLDVMHEGRLVRIRREPDNLNQIDPDFAMTSRPCPPYCVQPMHLAPGVETIGELELLEYLRRITRRDDRVLVVDCDDALRIARVGARSGLGEAEVRAVMAAQATREARLAAATEVLRNDGALDRLGEKVRPLHRKYLELAAAKLQAAC